MHFSKLTLKTLQASFSLFLGACIKFKDFRRLSKDKIQDKNLDFLNELTIKGLGFSSDGILH